MTDTGGKGWVWQPIETAPKDGTVIDLWMPAGSRPAHRVAACRWSELSDDYGGDWEAKYVEADGFTYLESFEDSGPTHWMPLPDPPKA